MTMTSRNGLYLIDFKSTARADRSARSVASSIIIKRSTVTRRTWDDELQMVAENIFPDSLWNPKRFRNVTIKRQTTRNIQQRNIYAGPVAKECSYLRLVLWKQNKKKKKKNTWRGESPVNARLL